MNQIATRRAPSFPNAVALDLSDERQRRLQQIITNTHTGRWPLWRGFAMHRDGDLLYELVEWVPRSRKVDAKRFNVVTWTVTLTSVGTTWQKEQMTRRSATVLFAEMKRGIAKLYRLTSPG